LAGGCPPYGGFGVVGEAVLDGPDIVGCEMVHDHRDALTNHRLGVDAG
jgi:hypothetical protein